jgi:hypothetical protein
MSKPTRPTPNDPSETDAELRQRALALYTPPFRYHMGYIHDSLGHMVSDTRDDEKDEDGERDLIARRIERVRGWGRMSYLVNAEKLQDMVGTMMAEAMTLAWNGQLLKQGETDDATKQA